MRAMRLACVLRQRTVCHLALSVISHAGLGPVGLAWSAAASSREDPGNSRRAELRLVWDACRSNQAALGECLPERGRHAIPCVGLDPAKVHTCAASAVDLGQGDLRPGSACQVGAVQRASINRRLFRSAGGVV